jgi:hypothetical protein
MTHQAYRTVAVGNDPFQQLGIRKLTYQTLRCAQHHDPADNQFFRRQWFVAGALKADKFGNIFQILTEDELIALGNNRDIAHTELEQAFATCRIVQDINGDEIDFFARKKLFRPETTASPRLGKQNELFVGAHIGPLCRRLKGSVRLTFSDAGRQGWQCYNPRAFFLHPVPPKQSI